MPQLCFKACVTHMQYDYLLGVFLSEGGQEGALHQQEIA